jgi:flagellar basal-body rod protein FlgB
LQEYWGWQAVWNDLFESVDMLQKGLQASWIRNSVIRNNIANVETPGFKSSEVVFESLVAEALGDSGFEGRKTRDRHIEIGRATDVSSISPRITQVFDTSMRMDENNVDIEAENANLAQNSIQYNTLMLKLNSELSRIRLAVTEGR